MSSESTENNIDSDQQIADDLGFSSIDEYKLWKIGQGSEEPSQQRIEESCYKRQIQILLEEITELKAEIKRLEDINVSLLQAIM